MTITAAYWFTASTSFANPAVTLARGFTQTFAGIALGDVAGFIAAQLVGAALGAWLSMALFPAQGTSSTHVIALVCPTAAKVAFSGKGEFPKLSNLPMSAPSRPLPAFTSATSKRGEVTNANP